MAEFVQRDLLALLQIADVNLIKCVCWQLRFTVQLYLSCLLQPAGHGSCALP